MDVAGEHGAALGQRHHGHGSRDQAGRELGAVDGVYRNIDLGLHAVADLLAEVEHRRLVLLALADHDCALHVDRGQRVAHGVDGTLVGRFLVAPPGQRSRGQGGRLGGAQQLERQVAVVGLVGHLFKSLAPQVRPG